MAFGDSCRFVFTLAKAVIDVDLPSVIVGVWGLKQGDYTGQLSLFLDDNVDNYLFYLRTSGVSTNAYEISDSLRYNVFSFSARIIFILFTFDLGERYVGGKVEPSFTVNLACVWVADLFSYQLEVWFKTAFAFLLFRRVLGLYCYEIVLSITKSD